jgi:hypothetical protein
MEVMYERVAAIDVGKKEIAVAVRTPGEGPGAARVQKIRKFKTFYPVLAQMVAWLVENGVTHVAMESTGVYWRRVFHALCEGDAGFEILLVNAGHVRRLRHHSERLHSAHGRARRRPASVVPTHDHVRPRHRSTHPRVRYLYRGPPGKQAPCKGHCAALGSPTHCARYAQLASTLGRGPSGWTRRSRAMASARSMISSAAVRNWTALRWRPAAKPHRRDVRGSPSRPHQARRHGTRKGTLHTRDGCKVYSLQHD